MQIFGVLSIFNNDQFENLSAYIKLKVRTILQKRRKRMMVKVHEMERTYDEPPSYRKKKNVDKLKGKDERS